PAIEAIKPSFFEITVAMAFDYFAQHSVDIAVIEVGLGGRLDSTNVITPLVSVITNISWDHKDLLGNSLREIASEKAGIIKTGIPVVISERQREIEHVFINKAGIEKAEISFASDEYTVEMNSEYGTIQVLKNKATLLKDTAFSLSGFYQRKNIPGVLKTVDVLQRYFSISPAQLKKGLEDVVRVTKLKGRWQTLQQNPMVVCDIAHNFSGVQEVLHQLSGMSFHRLHIVWGMVKDKEVNEILSILPKHATYYFCQAKIPRALDAHALKDMATKHGLVGEVVLDINEAKKSALARARNDDLIFIGGSTFVVAEIEEL
ncbi:MAG: Mur ligase family protein, partial [Cyclobacteriaceae bacterium]